MLYFLDEEFIEDGHTIDLVSIGLVCEDGREFYAERGEAELSRASDWVKANVLPHLRGGEWLTSRNVIASALRRFVAAGDGPPEFWSWCGAYDWVALCQLYGPMIAKPEGWPNYCRDLQQELDRFGITDDQLPPHPGTAHDALADAWWHRDIYMWLRETLMGRVTKQ